MANDLHGYDIASGVWTDLSSLSSGTPPPARALMGMAASGSKLYIFGGLGVLESPVQNVCSASGWSHFETHSSPLSESFCLPHPAVLGDSACVTVSSCI
eukprot:1002839-Rhodomonas_salina.5